MVGANSAGLDRAAATVPEVQLGAAARMPNCAGVVETQEKRRDHLPVSRGSAGLTVVLGDSYSEGWGLKNPMRSWPTAYGRAVNRTVYVNAVGASGLVSAGFCQDTTILQRLDRALAAAPDQLIVQTGLNDLTSSDADIRAALATIASRASMPVVLIGPPIVPARPAALSRHIDTLFRQVAAEHGWRYVSLVPLSLSMQADHAHPTTAGQQTLARYIVGALH